MYWFMDDLLNKALCLLNCIIIWSELSISKFHCMLLNKVKQACQRNREEQCNLFIELFCKTSARCGFVYLLVNYCLR